jgi:hypothetical protein
MGGLLNVVRCLTANDCQRLPVTNYHSSTTIHSCLPLSVCLPEPPDVALVMVQEALERLGVQGSVQGHVAAPAPAPAPAPAAPPTPPSVAVEPAVSKGERALAVHPGPCVGGAVLPEVGGWDIYCLTPNDLQQLPSTYPDSILALYPHYTLTFPLNVSLKLSNVSLKLSTKTVLLSMS